MNVWKWTTIAFTAATTAVVILNCGGTTTVVSTPAGGQPNMQGARNELQAAHDELQVAEHNKGGHRDKALELTNKALAEVDQGIAYAGN